MTARPAGGPRVRYIGFRINSPRPIPRQALINALRDTGRRIDAVAYAAAEPWLTRFDGTLGIVRCHHTHVDDARRMLTALEQATVEQDTIPLTVTTIATSGTIKSLTDHALRSMRDTGKPPKRR